MDSNVLQTLRYKLQKRLKRINTADYKIFHDVLVQTWGFLTADPTLRGIMDELERRVPSAEKESEQIINGTLLTGENELEHVALCYWVCKRCAQSKKSDVEIRLGHAFAHVSKHDEATEYFFEFFVEPVFDYLDEALDDHRTTLGLLRKFKHRIEWFGRTELRRRVEADTQRGEKTLAMDLYAYLHDQGLDFSIEPSSISGEADLISAQTGSGRLVADVKIFDPGKSKGLAYLVSGFGQVYQYTKDYNDPFGYLIIFKTCAEDLSINTKAQDSSIPFFTHNNKTIFVLVVDIFDYPVPASKRGQVKSYELVEDGLVKALSDPATASASVSSEKK